MPSKNLQEMKESTDKPRSITQQLSSRLINHVRANTNKKRNSLPCTTAHHVNDLSATCEHPTHQTVHGEIVLSTDDEFTWQDANDAASRSCRQRPGRLKNCRARYTKWLRKRPFRVLSVINCALFMFRARQALAREGYK